MAVLFERVRRNGGKIVYDLDDLMFLAELATIEVMDGIRSNGLREADVAADYARFKSALLAADHFCRADARLVREARELGKAAIVISNGEPNEDDSIAQRTACL